MPVRSPGFLAAAGLAALSASAQAPAGSARVTDPADFLGAKPGSDYYLANDTQIAGWLRKIAGESDRLKLVSIGRSAEGREQYMAIVSSPANIAKLDRYREISRRLALAKGLTDAEAHALAAEGRAVVWIDAGLHATEVANAQTHIQIIHEMLTRSDPETLRLLDDDIMLFVFANPDGLELVANWYMAPKDPKKRRTETIPVLYQKYIGHDNNRDSFMSNQPETTNMNRVAYREWFPQILYNEHQTGPVGTVVFIPPFRDPPNYNYEPLVINQTDAVGTAMHARLVERGMGGSVSRSGAPYSTWFNGGLRTIGYFHNTIGILTEIIGNPTPAEIPLVPANQLARQDEVLPIAPQPWHFQQSIDYIKEMDRAVLDYASRYRETLLYNRYVMGRNQIARGSGDSWIVTPKRIDALKAAASTATKKEGGGSPLDELAGYDTRTIVPTPLYEQVLHDPKQRMPRAYILSASAQADLPTTVKFVDALIKAGVEVERAAQPFTHEGRRYPAGSFVVRTDQAFRPHVLDMFEPQDHPQDFAFPGGPPVRPYDITGYTLAYQMNVAFDRALDAAPPHMPLVADVMETPPSGRIVGRGGAGWIVGHAANNAFTLTNRLLKAGVPVAWLTRETRVAGEALAPGALWIPAGGAAAGIVGTGVRTLGIDAYAVGAKPRGEALALRAPRIGLVDVYGGSMASGHTRWILEQYEFPYTLVYPQELDRGGLNAKYDVLLFQTDVLGREDRPSRQPAAEDIPAEWRPALGRITTAATVPQVAAFARAGGTVIAVGNATAFGERLGLPVTNALMAVGADGKRTPLPPATFYVPGSLLQARVDPADPLAYGMPERPYVFYNNNPTYTIGAGARRVAWFEGEDPLRSGWAWGQKALAGTSAVVDAPLGRGRVFLLAPEVTQRGQSYGTFKLLLNGLLYGPSAVAAGG